MQIKAKKANIDIESWEVWDGFILDLVTKGTETYEAWIYHTDYGIKTLMWGVPQDSTTYGEFKDMVASSVAENIEGYKEEYMDGDEEKILLF